jgi:hypothetical protein
LADSPFSWAPYNVDSSNDLTAVSCASASLCVAGETGGNVVTSTNPTGGAGAWNGAHASTSGNYAIRGVSCPSPSLCVLVDAAGNVVTSTDPTGGAAAWTTADVVGAGILSAVSCPSASLCAAVDTSGNVVTSTDPTGGAGAWNVADAGGPGVGFSGVSCPSTSLCVVVGSGGSVVTSTDPTGGAGAWTTSNVAGAGGFQAVSCASASLCVATAGTDVVTSTDPTGGGGAWTIAHLGGSGGIFVGLISVSCPSASLCVAVDFDDGVVTSTNPTGGAGAWSFARVEKAGVFNAVSCASTTLCVIVDLIGDVVVGTPAVPPVIGPGSGPGSGAGSSIAPPVVKILSGPPAETADRQATFTFRGVSRGTYECSIDAGAWAPCASGAIFGPLPPGDHLFRVRETLAGLTGPTASYHWTIDLPRECVLRVARARIYVAPKKRKVRLVIHYTSYRPATVGVSFDLLGSKGITGLGDTSASFATAGVFRDPEILSSKVFGEVRKAKLFKVRFQIAKTPRSCGRYYTKLITIPKKFSDRTVWFQSDSSFAP